MSSICAIDCTGQLSSWISVKTQSDWLQWKEQRSHFNFALWTNFLAQILIEIELFEEWMTYMSSICAINHTIIIMGTGQETNLLLTAMHYLNVCLTVGEPKKCNFIVVATKLQPCTLCRTCTTGWLAYTPVIFARFTAHSISSHKAQKVHRWKEQRKHFHFALWTNFLAQILIEIELFVATLYTAV